MVNLPGRFGWSDSIGPLLFLRERWTVGPSWRSCWARFFASLRGVTLQAHTKKGGFPYAGVVVDLGLWQDMSYAQKEDFVMGWLKQVRRPDGPLGSGGLATDPEWMSLYPALTEYLTVGAHEDGSPRRTATLTLFSEHSSWKCYLNERDASASLCATGPTVSEALTALEIMLEGEVVPWRFSDPPRPENGRKQRKAP